MLALLASMVSTVVVVFFFPQQKHVKMIYV